jgi:hypothetical protein
VRNTAAAADGRGVFPVGFVATGVVVVVAVVVSVAGIVFFSFLA